jgi:hypothetical protein
MKTLEKATSRELEIQQVRNAMTDTAAKIVLMESALEAMRRKQTARVREIAIQETLARCYEKSSHAGAVTHK